jgi:hypothetical protein
MVNEAFPRFVKYGFKTLHVSRPGARAGGSRIEKIFGKSARAICAQALNFGFIRACYVRSQLRDNKSQTGTR